LGRLVRSQASKTRGAAIPTSDAQPVRAAAGDQPAGAGIAVRGVSKVFPDGTAALTPTDFEIDEGQLVSIVGPSGCGKSTLLRIIAGLIPASAGECSTVGGSSRAFVFQDPTLLPWRTVRKNAQLLLELEGFNKEERQSRAASALRLVGLDGFEKAYPRSLSGGMKMRLSLARSLALRPKLFLMDEPFSALDELTRETLQDELLRIWSSEGFTALFVTHNLYEAVYLSSRVIVLSARPGRVVADVEVPLRYPRTTEMRQAPEFNEIAARVSNALRGGAAE
jgi:NitT/TauT family transport system ATP-binding protein